MWLPRRMGALSSWPKSFLDCSAMVMRRCHEGKLMWLMGWVTGPLGAGWVDLSVDSARKQQFEEGFVGRIQFFHQIGRGHGVFCFHLKVQISDQVLNAVNTVQGRHPHIVDRVFVPGSFCTEYGVDIHQDVKTGIFLLQCLQKIVQLIIRQIHAEPFQQYNGFVAVRQFRDLFRITGVQSRHVTGIGFRVVLSSNRDYLRQITVDPFRVRLLYSHASAVQAAADVQHKGSIVLLQHGFRPVVKHHCAHRHVVGQPF